MMVMIQVVVAGANATAVAHREAKMLRGRVVGRIGAVQSNMAVMVKI
jgi:hypothetical protein